MKQKMYHWLAAAGLLLLPWPGLLLGMWGLSLSQWLSAPSLQTLLSMWGNDVLLSVRAVPVWLLCTLPVLVVNERRRWVMLGMVGSLCLIVLALLDLYFSVAGVPLGADLFAYSWQELHTTVTATAISPSAAWSTALVIALLVLWGSLWWLRTHQFQSPLPTVGVLALCVGSSVVLPVQLPESSPASSNKLQFFVSSVFMPGLPTTSQVGMADYPFEHAETTPDTLGPLFNLDAKNPPHLLFLIIEGLGRDFSGVGARLGSFTPFLDELAEKSLYWDNFLATQGRTFAVLPSVFGSLPFSSAYGEQDIPNDNLLTLLKNQAHELRYFSGTGLEFDHQGAFLQKNGVDRFWSASNFVPPAKKLSEWGYPDGDLIQAVLDQPVPPVPSVTIVQTMSMHTPFVIPQPQKYQQKLEARLDALGLTPIQRAPYREQKDIYASILYTDDVLREFFTQMAGRPEWQNTIVVITGDHRLPEIPMDTSIERYHVPLIIHSPMLRQPMHIKSVSSHFDIAPSLLAMLSHRYAWATPQHVHWMGTGLDTQTTWRNVHVLPIKKTKTELSDYVSGEYYWSQNRLFSLQDGLHTAPEDNPNMAENLRQALVTFQSNLTQLTRQNRLVAPEHQNQRMLYNETGRSLAAAHTQAHQIQGVVVSGVQVHWDAQQQQVQAQGQFDWKGLSDATSPTFVPLLVLTDADGNELGEAYGAALRLQVGQSHGVQLQLKPNMPLGDGAYFLSLIPSHPETGRPVGKGQYHVALRR